MTIFIRAEGVGKTRAIASVGDPHNCHKILNLVFHLGGAIMNGSSFVSVHGRPVARVGDKAHCHPVHDHIKQGVSGITINGKEIAAAGNHFDHGGVITQGASDIFVAELIDYENTK